MGDPRETREPSVNCLLGGLTSARRLVRLNAFEPETTMHGWAPGRGVLEVAAQLSQRVTSTSQEPSRPINLGRRLMSASIERRRPNVGQSPLGA